MLAYDPMSSVGAGSQLALAEGSFGPSTSGAGGMSGMLSGALTGGSIATDLISTYAQAMQMEMQRKHTRQRQRLERGELVGQLRFQEGAAIAQAAVMGVETTSGSMGDFFAAQKFTGKRSRAFQSYQHKMERAMQRMQRLQAYSNMAGSLINTATLGLL